MKDSNNVSVATDQGIVVPAPNCESPIKELNPHSKETSKQNIPYLDGWRGAAILFVLLDHFFDIPIGHLGVDLFFALSGMLMAKVLFTDQTKIHVFYLRRIARIFPGFYFYLSIISIFSILYIEVFPLEDLAYTAIFLRSYFPMKSIWEESIPIGHIWSLSVEEHSYVILSSIPFILYKFCKPSATIILVIASIISASFFVYYSISPPSSTLTPPVARSECASFSIFISAAIYCGLKGKDSIPSKFLFYTSILIVLVICIAHYEGVAKYLATPLLLAVCINCIYIENGVIQKILSCKPFTWLGTCSFSIYLWQQPIYLLHKTGNLIQPSPVLFSIALILGAAAFYFVEKPCRAKIRCLAG